MNPNLGVLELRDVLTRIDQMVDRPPSNVAHADTRNGQVYLATPRLLTAVKVALVTGRPLLVSGPPGGGKSSFAAYVARNLGVAYYEFVAMDESRSTELLWTLDSVRRLADAQVNRLPDDSDPLPLGRYLSPGPLWWAFDPESAARRGMPQETHQGIVTAVDPQIDLGEVRHQGAVVLIDEIDKADNAFNNGLLVPLGSRSFDVAPLGARVSTGTGWSPLIIISTNQERDLSPAFLRRCVTIELPHPDGTQLVEIARRHIPERLLNDRLVEAIEDLVQILSDGSHVGATSAAEFLDLVRVLVETGDFEVGSEYWQLVRSLVLSASSRRSLR